MCRWFAYVSETEPCLLEDVLVLPANSLCHQVHEHYLPKLIHHDPKGPPQDRDKLVWARNSLLNMDGCGIAWYNHTAESWQPSVQGMRPAMYKTMSTPVNDFNFRSICRTAESKAVFAHIRAATSMIQQSNCHPFVFGRHTFMHNGVIASFDRVRRDMSFMMDHDAFTNVLGSTDSEHLAGLYMTYLTGGKGKSSWEQTYDVEKMAWALCEAVRSVLKLQQKVDKVAPNSLNLAVTDGYKLVALRFRNHDSEEPPSLYYSTTAGTTLNRKFPGHPDSGETVNHEAIKTSEEHGKHVVVSSEPTTYDENEWNLIRKNCCLTVDKGGSIEIKEMEYDHTFNAVDPSA